MNHLQTLNPVPIISQVMAFSFLQADTTTPQLLLITQDAVRGAAPVRLIGTTITPTLHTHREETGKLNPEHPAHRGSVMKDRDIMCPRNSLQTSWSAGDGRWWTRPNRGRRTERIMWRDTRDKMSRKNSGNKMWSVTTMLVSFITWSWRALPALHWRTEWRGTSTPFRGQRPLWTTLWRDEDTEHLLYRRF